MGIKEYVRETLKGAEVLPSPMADESFSVRDSGPGAPSYPVKGIVDHESNLAKMQTVDSGVDDFPSLYQGQTLYGFVPLTVGTNTRSLDDLYSDAFASGTNNALVPIIAKRSITFFADSGNSAAVRIGNRATTTAIGFPLVAGSSLTLEITKGSNIFLCAASGSQTVSWIAV